MGLKYQGDRQDLSDSTQSLIGLGSGQSNWIWLERPDLIGIWSENLAVSQPFEAMKFQVDSEQIHLDLVGYRKDLQKR